MSAPPEIVAEVRGVFEMVKRLRDVMKLDDQVFLTPCFTITVIPGVAKRRPGIHGRLKKRLDFCFRRNDGKNLNID